MPRSVSANRTLRCIQLFCVKHVYTPVGGIMPCDASCLGQNAAVMEYQSGSQMCKTIKLTGISILFIILITFPLRLEPLVRGGRSG
jgi:hypothetical protein